MEFFVLAIFGLVAGVLAGIFGIGGGTIIVPVMMFFGFDIKNAIGISVMQMIFSSIYGTYLNLKLKLLDINKGCYLAFGGFIGGGCSGFVVDILPSEWLLISFSLICAYSLFRVIVKPSRGELLKKTNNERLTLFLIGFLTGIFAISLGIGGGLIIVPLVSYYLGLSTKSVVPISLFFVIFASIAGFGTLSLHSYVNYKEGFIVGIFSLIGVYFGIKLNKFISHKLHRLAVITLYLIVLLVMCRNIYFKIF